MTWRWIRALFKAKDLPEIDAEGQVNYESFRRIDLNSLKNWISRVLGHGDPRVVAYRDEESYAYLGRIYRELSADAREVFQDAVISLLAAASSDSAARHDLPIDDLLLLVTEVFSESEHRRAEPAPHLLMMVEGDSDNSRGLQFRLLQTLVSLSYRVDIDFWERQFERDRDYFAGVTFVGISLIDLECGFTWLRRYATYPRAMDALLGRLPMLLRDYPWDTLKNLIKELCLHLPQRELEQLVHFAKELEIPVDPSPDFSPFVEWTTEDLSLLIKALNFLSIMTSDDRQGWVEELDTRLRNMLPRKSSEFDVPRSALTILSACQQIANLPKDRKPRSMVDKIVEQARKLADATENEEFAREVMAAVAYAEDEQTDDSKRQENLLNMALPPEVAEKYQEVVEDELVLV